MSLVLKKSLRGFEITAVVLALSACGVRDTRDTQTTVDPVVPGDQGGTNLAAPGHTDIIIPEFEKSPDEIQATLNAALKTADEALKELVSQDAARLSFASTFVKFDEIITAVDNAAMRLGVIENTHTDETIRNSAFEAGQAFSSWYVALGFRKDLYQLFRSAKEQLDLAVLDVEDKRLVDETLLDFERNGLNLPDEAQAELKKLNEELSQKTNVISKNITDDPGLIELKKSELEGVPADFLETIKKVGSDDNYEVQTKVNTQYRIVMENALNEETRKKVMIAAYSRAKGVNESLIKEVIGIRARIAELLGYKSWADYRMEPRMAKDAKTAQSFLNNFSERLEPKFKSESQELATLKGSTLNIWDVAFYSDKLRKTKYQVDTEVLRDYFPMEQTLEGMFNVYEKIFAIQLKEVSAPYKWVEDLKLYEVSDAQTGKSLGLIYMDLFPREGKYGHFASFGVRAGRDLGQGKNYRPINALICNFPRPEAGKPSLLSHDNVTTLFHEFGHALHSVLTQTKYSRFSGTSVPRDFVEAPSQLLERWAWNPDVLDTFAAHWSEPTKKLPSDILARMRQAELGLIGHDYRRQVTYAQMDLKLHSIPKPDAVPADIYGLANNAFETFYYPVPKETAFLANFGHLFGGYDAGYYGYAWADAISADMATVFDKAPGQYFDAEAGMKLRHEIYETGGSREVTESIEKFLGRPWNLDAFFRWLGLGETQANR